MICIYANQNAIIHKLSNKETSSKEPKGKSNESISYEYAIKHMQIRGFCIYVPGRFGKSLELFNEPSFVCL